MGRRWERLNRAEARALAGDPALPDRPPSRVVMAVTTAARGGGLWLALCAAEALRPGGDRRVARHAALAVVAALGLAHLIKRGTPRRARPEPPGGPARRLLKERPDSSSFPSAHAATAAAFTAAVVAHDVRRATLVAPLTLTAIYGRLRARVHWPTDLLAGVTLGVGTAALVGWILDR
ncbi:MAG TPA: phosphatase PAP2 family protein [Actinophytocola sp.]|uniref:phosphatase PAP2 family protein n=1 Tax=Actinophytocola sp. TaxID=1872138 RepID=UPI002DBB997B|nr:phosphatase PAP2 family protein [Actinophytocola sp.]HEU5475628.1 phosphatase PAP2 family protein [Actinophytocola sp.]